MDGRPMPYASVDRQAGRMTPTLAGFLTVMALVDATSIGTLVIPVWLVLATPRERMGRVVLYLVTIAAFYLLLGLALAAGARAAFDHLGDVLDSPAAGVVAIVLGAVLVWWSHRTDPKVQAKRGDDPQASSRRWHARIASALGTRTGVITLALVAGIIEAASMLPYLAAIGALASADLGAAATAATLAAYCVVMVLPALAILVLRIVAARRVDRPLQRVGAWAERNAGTAASWTFGIVGVLLVLNGLGAVA